MSWDPAGAPHRRSSYFALVREEARRLFKPDGSYGAEILPDARIAYWIGPALWESQDEEDRALGRAIYQAGAGWNQFDIFMTSLIASHTKRRAEALGPELVNRGLDHLSKFAMANRGRAPSAAIYDYMFHGYNDNMPALAARTLVFAGELLDRTELLEHGHFVLQGLAAHFQRRGLLSECTSPTYTPLTVNVLLDIAEGTTHRQIADLAQACANRILLDIFAHWHGPTGSSGGATPRAYTVDVTQGLSVLNAYLWYLTGDPATMDPGRALLEPGFYKGPVHMTRNVAFNLAQFVDVMLAAHDRVSPEIADYLSAVRTYPRTISATTDWAETDRIGGCRAALSTSYQRQRWWLGTLSTTTTGRTAGQSRALMGALAPRSVPCPWEEKVTFWTCLLAGERDYGRPDQRTTYVHSGTLPSDPAIASPVEPDDVPDLGFYHTLQKDGQAMLVGAPALGGLPENSTNLRFIFALRAGLPPDEMADSQGPLPSWEGNTEGGRWLFLRFGEVYLAVRLAGMVDGVLRPIQRSHKWGYLRLEVSLEQEPRNNPPRLMDFGLVLEMGDAEEDGTFHDFIHSTLATRWEFHRNFYRCSRYLGRHGELHIVDAPEGGTARFSAVDGQTQPWPLFACTDMPAHLPRLPTELLRGTQQRTLPFPDVVQSPFYDRPCQLIVNDFHS